MLICDTIPGFSFTALWKDMEMEGSKRTSILMNVRFFAVFCGGVVFGFVLNDLFFVGKTVREFKNERKVLMTRLLCETDHQVLLEACRELSRRVDAGDLKSGRYDINNRYEHASQFPKVILDLQPRYVYIDENDSGRVIIPIFRGFDHFGVTAYTEDYMESGSKYKYVDKELFYGDRELIPGLWYYDDGYIDDPEYDKKIDKLIEKHKKSK